MANYKPGANVGDFVSATGSGTDAQPYVPDVATLAGDVSNASFQRPADSTPYAAGDLVANSTTAGSVAPLSIAISRAAGRASRILRARLRKSTASLVNASFRLHLFRAAPVVNAGDNAAFNVTGIADYIGAIDITMDQALTDGAVGFGVPNVGPCIVTVPVAGTTISALLEARGAYTPGSGELFTAVLELDRD
jgi:hypothetical protein